MDREQEVLVKLIQIGNTKKPLDIPSEVDWNKLIKLANKHGVLCFTFDALYFLPECNRPDKKIISNWYGNVFHMESLYDKHKKTISSLAKFYSKYDIKMMLMKGYGLSLYWPKPNHRPTGDMDTFNFGMHDEADRLIQEKYGVKIDNSHHKHSVFNFRGVTVENHYSFLNTHGHRSTAEIENILHSVINETEDREIDNLYYPSTKFNSLYLLRHSAEHFASVDLSLRIILDWGFFVKGNKVDWDWLLTTLDKVGMKEYLAVINAICVKYLGFEASLFPVLPVKDALVDRSFADVMHPEVEKEQHENTILEIIFRFKRWWKNRWKHDMVFRENIWQSLVTQLVSHILKPNL